MRTYPHLLLFLFGFLCNFFVVQAFGLSDEADMKVPQPIVDERVELLGIVFRLAGSPEYQKVVFDEYDDAINKHFAPFKTHTVIRSASLLRSTSGISFDAVMNYAVHISIEEGRVVFPNADSEKTLEKLEYRWKPAAAKLFAEQLDDFYVKSRFREFFEANSEMYQKTEQRIKEINDKVDYSWFKKFYGDADLEHLHVFLSNINENKGYGPSCLFKDGHKECFAIIGVCGPNAPYREDGYISLIIHEFSHSFCNPLVDRHIDGLKPAAERIFPLVTDTMARQVCSTPLAMLYEYLVHACVIHYWITHGNTTNADGLLRYDRSLGFLWLEELVEVLGCYEQERDKYLTLDDFMPEIVKLQNAIVTDEYIAELRKQEESRPKITVINPPNGAKNVDPSITEIAITFDRPMMDDLGWNTQNAGRMFPERSEHSPLVWSDDKRTCTLSHVVLRPGRMYNYRIGGAENFRSADGVLLTPIFYTFTTRAE